MYYILSVFIMRKEVEELLKEYNELKGLNLSFNLARGKPNKEYLSCLIYLLK